MRYTLRLLLTVMLLSAPAMAQWLDYPTPGVPRLPNGKPDLSAPAPRTADHKPDFSGLWEPAKGEASQFGAVVQLAPEFTNIAANLKASLPYRPWAAALVKKREEDNGKDGPDGHCLPLSIVQKHSHPFPRKMLQFPGVLIVLYEKGVEYRQIFTDGRPLPRDPNPAFLGYSTGKWEGDTLVVQTIGFRDDEWLDATGNPLTEAAKITERFRRPNFGSLEISVTVDDPKAYTAPWTVHLKQHLKLDAELLEYFCENERDLVHLVGK